jgi:hypothetical protein
MRKRLAVACVLVVLAAVPAAVFAAGGVSGSALDRQAARWTTTPATTSSTNWRNVPALSLARCTVNQVTAMLSATVRGGPVGFRVIIDGVPEAPMRPGPARFVPDGSESFSYTFVGRTVSFEVDDTHRFTVQWRSPSGRPVQLENGALTVLYEQGTLGC